MLLRKNAIADRCGRGGPYLGETTAEQEAIAETFHRKVVCTRMYGDALDGVLNRSPTPVLVTLKAVDPKLFPLGKLEIQSCRLVKDVQP